MENAPRGCRGAGLPSHWWTGALPGAARGRGGTFAVADRSHWITLVEHAVAAAPTGQVAVASDATWVDAFAVPVRPLVAEATQRLVAGGAQLADAIDLPAVADGFASRLARRLALVAARTLVLELNIERLANRLKGDDPAARFADFVSNVSARARLIALIAEYPVLARLLGDACVLAAEAHVELLSRFAADRKAVADVLLGGRDPGPLVEIDAGAGDTHRRGRAVAILRFAGGARIVYKPRPQALVGHFAEAVRWLNAAVPDLSLRPVTVVTRRGYGWQEFVSVEPCQDRTGVTRFYRRLGALTALLYAVDAADIHCENVIACGDQPVLVDVETLFHPVLPSPSVTPDPGARDLSTSVYRTAMLPRLIVGDRGALDVSGLGGDRGAALPGDIVNWESPNTDRMRLVRSAGEYPGAANRPRPVGGPDADPVDHEPALLEGFRAGYDAIQQGREAFGRLVRRCYRDEIRVIVRPTEIYVRLLDETTHPDVLRDAVDRDRIFEALRVASVDDPVRTRLVDHEIADLWSGDVPVFTSTPISRDLRTTSGQVVTDALAEPGLAGTLRKLAAMGPADRRTQEWVIRVSLASRRHATGRVVVAPQVAAGVDDVPPGPLPLLDRARAIADHLVDCAATDGDRANWTGLEPVDGVGWLLRPMGAGLAHGYCGVALFLAELARLTGESRYADLARRAVSPLPRLCAMLSNRPDLVEAIGCGGFNGLGGICYTLARLSALPGSHETDGCLDAALNLATAAVDFEESIGLTDGVAGCLAAMTAVDIETGLPAAARLAVRCAERLVMLPPSGPQPDGFASGAVGVAWALLRFADHSGQSRFARHGEAILTARHTPWLDSDSGSVTDGESSWCCGTAGTVMAHARLTCPHANRMAEVLGAAPPAGDLSLCHGEMGTGDALAMLSTRYASAAIARTLHRRAATVLRTIDRDGPRCGTPGGVPTPGLLAGLAGIGYGLLRLAFPDRTPSVLMLESTREHAYRDKGGTT